MASQYRESGREGDEGNATVLFIQAISTSSLNLDEIIRAIHRANNQMINIEKLSDEELEGLATQFEQISVACEARKKMVKASY